MAATQKVVPDASVVIKWYNLENDTEAALKLRRDYATHKINLTAPLVLAYEVANALRYSPDFGTEDAKIAVKDLLDMQISFEQLSESQARRAVELAFNYGITFYDATYVALAETEETTLYTADEKLIAKVSSKSVTHIRDYIPA
jgi:predicted nucleic acid-binding protein